MAMSSNKSWSAIILFTILLTGSLCLAAPSPQELPPEDPDAEEEISPALERLRNQADQIEQLPGPSPQEV